MEKQSAVVLCDVKLSWLGEFGEWLCEGRSGRTCAAYLRDLDHFMGWWAKVNGCAFDPRELNSRDLRDYRAWCLEVERCAPATWNRRRATLGVLNGFCVEVLGQDGLRFERVVRRAAEVEQAPRWLCQAEERKLMRQVELNVLGANTSQRKGRAVRDAALVALMRYAGLRVEECANLEVGDAQIGERKGCVVVRLGKREKSRRVPLSGAAREAVASWVAVRPCSASAFLFVDEHGEGLTTRAIQKRVEGLAGQCGFEVSCHMLRHTCAKSMLDAGRPLTEVQRILGHEKLETTARYVQPGQEDLEEAVELGALGKAVQPVVIRFK